MAQPTDSHGAGSAPAGPALAILATAPRPGLVLTGCCPPLTPVEAGALQTAWLKQIVQELPGVQVHLLGRPADAAPMLRYFAGPGVELQEWRDRSDEHGPVDPMLAAAAALFAAGSGPVLVRTADAPEPRQDDLLSCVAAARQGQMVWAPDQRGAPWLCAFASVAQVHELAAASRERRRLDPALPLRRGPWARTVQHHDDLLLLLRERQPEHGAAWLPVPDLQSALQFFEVVFEAELLAREPEAAAIAFAGTELRLVARRDFVRNGMRVPTPDAAALHASLAGRGAIAPGDELATTVAGRANFTVTDPFGNRLLFEAPAP